MSYEFALERPCSHEVWFERSVIDPISRDNIRFQRQLSSNRMRVYIDDLEVPSSGLYSPSFLVSTLSEPFRIKKGVNDILYIKIGNELPLMIEMITGSNVKSNDLAKYLQGKVPSLIFESLNGKLKISSRTSGKNDYFCLVDPTWSDKTKSLPNTLRSLNFLKTLGFNPGRKAFPTLIYPSWKIVLDTNSFTDDKILLFSSPIKNDNPYIQLTYTTTRGNCRRCFGSDIEFDYGVFGGNYETVRNTDLLLQEFDKFLFTRSGSHWKWTWLGSKLTDRIGGKYLVTGGITNSLINLDISQAFKYYQNIKSQQDDTVFQQVTDAEYPIDISNVSVQTSPNDPTIALVSMDIIPRSRDLVPLQRVVGDEQPRFRG